MAFQGHLKLGHGPLITKYCELLAVKLDFHRKVSVALFLPLPPPPFISLFIPSCADSNTCLLTVCASSESPVPRKSADHQWRIGADRWRWRQQLVRHIWKGKSTWSFFVDIWSCMCLFGAVSSCRWRYSTTWSAFSTWPRRSLVRSTWAVQIPWHMPDSAVWSYWFPASSTHASCMTLSSRWCFACTHVSHPRPKKWEIPNFVWLIDSLGARLIDWSVDRLFCRLLHRLIDWLLDWVLVAWSTDWLIDWLSNPTVYCIYDHPSCLCSSSARYSHGAQRTVC